MDSGAVVVVDAHRLPLRLVSTDDQFLAPLLSMYVGTYVSWVQSMMINADKINAIIMTRI